MPMLMIRVIVISTSHSEDECPAVILFMAAASAAGPGRCTTGRFRRCVRFD